MDKPEPDFTANDLLSQISAQLNFTDEGLSTKELCEGMGLLPTSTNMARVRRHVRDLLALGKAEYAGKKRAVTIIGTEWSVAAWKLVEE